MISAVLGWPVAAYIRAHRDRLAAAGAALAADDRDWLGGYFGAETLDRVRVVVRDPLPISVPPFTGIVRRLGFSFPEVTLIAAITFDHVIATRLPMGRSTLFHELVHVAQFRLLGIRQFSRLYVGGLLSSGSYEEIPLERCAYELEDRFMAGEHGFSVESEVAGWNSRGWFCVKPPRRRPAADR